MTMQTEPVATEPPHEEECTFCGGQGRVNAVEVENVAGERFGFRYAREEMVLLCPLCKLGMTLNGKRLE